MGGINKAIGKREKVDLTGYLIEGEQEVEEEKIEVKKKKVEPVVTVKTVVGKSTPIQYLVKEAKQIAKTKKEL